MEFIESALQKTKTFQLDQVIELILKIQEEESKKVKPKVTEHQKEYEYISYNCSACTFANTEKPGKSCIICGTAAPETAKILKENPINSQLKQQEEEKLQKEL